MISYSIYKEKLEFSDFRSRFCLRSMERAYIAAKGWGVIETQAREFILNRLAPANPSNDGRQTPMRGNPIFVAQHATATCCRGCLKKWYDVPMDRPLNDAEVNDAVAMIMRWLVEHAGDLSGFPVSPELFPEDNPEDGH